MILLMKLVEETILRYKHLLIGISCIHEGSEFCKEKYNEPNINCIINNCEFIKYEECKNTLVYSNSNGEIEEKSNYLCFDEVAKLYKDKREVKRLSKFLGRKISIRKINEAYVEYKNGI